MVTLFPTGTNLILVTLVLNLAFFVPGDSGSTWASPVTGDSDPKHGLTSRVTVVPNGTSPGPHVSGPTWASPGPGPESSSPGEADMVTLVPIWMSPRPGETGSPLGLK